MTDSIYYLYLQIQVPCGRLRPVAGGGGPPDGGGPAMALPVRIDQLHFI